MKHTLNISLVQLEIGLTAEKTTIQAEDHSQQLLPEKKSSPCYGCNDSERRGETLHKL